MLRFLRQRNLRSLPRFEPVPGGLAGTQRRIAGVQPYDQRARLIA
jgi:hypothetical protein